VPGGDLCKTIISIVLVFQSFCQCVSFIAIIGSFQKEIKKFEYWVSGKGTFKLRRGNLPLLFNQSSNFLTSFLNRTIPAINDVIPALTPINILSNDYFGDLCQSRISL
jgi:hypothetical protein